MRPVGAALTAAEDASRAGAANATEPILSRSSTVRRSAILRPMPLTWVSRATSAVLTAVIGLAFQETLGNVVGGLALQLDNSIRVGEWIKIGDINGRVTEIRWRYTAIETRAWESTDKMANWPARSLVTRNARRSPSESGSPRCRVP